LAAATLRKISQFRTLHNDKHQFKRIAKLEQPRLRKRFPTSFRKPDPKQIQSWSRPIVIK